LATWVEANLEHLAVGFSAVRLAHFCPSFIATGCVRGFQADVVTL
jgi:hypothetical protein